MNTEAAKFYTVAAENYAIAAQAFLRAAANAIRASTAANKMSDLALSIKSRDVKVNDTSAQMRLSVSQLYSENSHRCEVLSRDWR